MSHFSRCLGAVSWAIWPTKWLFLAARAIFELLGSYGAETLRRSMRSYRRELTRLHQHPEVKRDWASLVLP